MITVTIGTSTVNVDDASEGWIGRMFTQAAGAQPCVRVQIDISGAKFSLASAACGGYPSNWRPNAKEQLIIDEWQAQHLGSTHLAPGNVEAFLKKLRKYV